VRGESGEGEQSDLVSRDRALCLMSWTYTVGGNVLEVLMDKVRSIRYQGVGGTKRSWSEAAASAVFGLLSPSNDRKSLPNARNVTEPFNVVSTLSIAARSRGFGVTCTCQREQLASEN